ncbi:MAG: hypothetical protein RLZZ65_1276 [Bacteroidota bacterium]|jgi:hypothetical protein
MKKGLWIIGLVVMSTLIGVTVKYYFSSTAVYTSLNPQANYFYPLDTIPKIYLYRDAKHGLEEEFHRIYTVEDAVGPHLIVEVYESDGRLREAINYNIDSLCVQDHMVVNRMQNKEKALLYKNQLFPFDLQKETWFASKFSGLTDSTVILYEVFRKFQSKKPAQFLGKKSAPSLYFTDKIRGTTLNPFTRKEAEQTGQRTSVFAENTGLVEWYNADKSIHYRLEKILSQQEWIKIINR